MLFLCPGNHDINRDEVEDIQYPTDQCNANRFLRIEKLDKLQRRFAQYIEFCKNLGLEKYTIGSKSSYLVGCRDMGRFRVVCLNTAWYAKEDAVKDKMWVGAGFWEIVKEGLAKCKKPTVAIMHHPSSSWHEQERSMYLDRTNIYSEICDFADIILSGHTHEIKDSMEQKGKALVGASGALYEGKHYPNCFYTYNVDFASQGLQSRTRYFWNAGKWIPDQETFRLVNAYNIDFCKYPDSGQEAGAAMIGKSESLPFQSNLFCIADQVIKFIPIIGSWNKGENEYYDGDIIIHDSKKTYELPEEFLDCFSQLPGSQEKIIENIYEDKVRLNEINVEITGGDRPHRIVLDISKATYRDFLIVKSVIDQRLPSGDTVRNKYFDEKDSLISRKLPNICGVGIYVITSDNKVLISKSSPYVIVNPEQHIYSASGSMNWNAGKTDPFDDVIRECSEEIGYKPDIERLRLYSIGIDYATGYYQFSFYERSDKTAGEIIKDAHMARDFHIEIQKIIPVDFQCDKIMAMVMGSSQWDETAKANLLTLAVKNFGKTEVERYLSPDRIKKDFRRSAIQEWDLRADRHGRLAVYSSRYPARNLEKISGAYVNAVLDFIDEDLSEKTVLEIGGGIGLFTKHFAEHAKAVTCIDVCEKMNARNRN